MALRTDRQELHLMITTKSAHQPMEDGHRFALYVVIVSDRTRELETILDEVTGVRILDTFQERADAEDSEIVERASGL
jgi:hypothetical protein